MSLDATRWAWMQKGLRPIQKLILLSLADRVGVDDLAFPSYKCLEEDTGADRKTVYASLKGLEAIGLIQDSGERTGATGQIVVWKLVGVEHRTEAESIPKTEPSQKRNGSVFSAKGSQKRTGKDPKNGIRNLPGNLPGESTGEREAPPTKNIADSSPQERGTRLPDDWELPPDWGEWARQETGWAMQQVLRVATRFRNYWIAKPGKEGLKRNWKATWENWVLNEDEPRQRQQQQRNGGPRKFGGWNYDPTAEADRDF